MTRTSFARSIARFSVCALFGVARTVLAQGAEPPSAATPEPPPYSAWSGNGPHAPPPAIVLGAPPAPELPPAEYARRPLELVPELLLAFPSCADGSVNHARCDGLGAGAGFGGSALWRALPYFAFGGTLNLLRFGFDPARTTDLRDGHASGLFYGLIGRVYFADHGPVEPYLELGLGGGADRTSARETGDITYSEAASGGAVRVGGAVELYLSRHVRLGPAFAWTRFRVRQLQRCDAARACVDLAQDQNAHGDGFLTFSTRLTISLGPGL